jgi:hypothetical protein
VSTHRVVLDLLDIVVGDGDVLATGVVALRGDEDRAVVRQPPQSVIGPVVAVGPTGVDVDRGAVQPVVPEDQPALGVVVVVVRQPQAVRRRRSGPTTD